MKIKLITLSKTIEKIVIVSVLCVSWVQPGASDLATNSDEESLLAKPAIWSSQEWTANDHPFRAAKTEIDKAVKNGKKPEVVAQACEGQANKRPLQAIAVFRWAYAVDKAVAAKKPFDPEGLRKPLILMRRTMPPHSYEYARLRFLLESSLGGSGSYSLTKMVGERLLQRNPKDVSVKMRMCSILTSSRNPQEPQRALKMAKELVADNSKSANRYLCLGNVYYSLWFRDQQKVQREGAIAAFRQYLKLKPANEPGRERVQGLINLLQRTKDMPYKTKAQPTKSR